MEIISRAPNREISLVRCMLDGVLEKLCLKSKQQIGKLLGIWKKNKLYYHLESKTQPSTERSVALSSSVAYEKLIHKLHNRLNIFEVAWSHMVCAERHQSRGLQCPTLLSFTKPKCKGICMEAVGRLRARMNLTFNLQVGSEVICSF